jgi:hypothetical protein
LGGTRMKERTRITRSSHHPMTLRLG